MRFRLSDAVQTDGTKGFWHPDEGMRYELEFRQQKHREAHEYFRTALALARNPMERHFLKQRLGRCEEYMSNPSRLDN